MKNYGLSSYQRYKALKKLEFNRDYMLSNGIQLDNKIIPFADFVCNSYTNSDRYIAELQHRAWSTYDYAKEKNLKNIFFSLTLPSKWHPMKTINFGKKNEKLVFNKKFGGRRIIKVHTKQKNKYHFLNAHVKQNIPFIEPILDYTNTVDKYSPHNASKELSRLLSAGLFNERSYRKIDKEHRCYFRVTEPHKDGTPHLHISLYVPENKVNSIVKSLKRCYPAPMGDIETNVNNPVSYLMKYVLKTLDDLRDNPEKITNLTLWYLHHGISRFYTSRTFISLEVYRKLNGMYTLIDLTKKYKSNDICIYVYSDTKKIALIENEYGTIYIPKPVNWYDKLVDTDHTYLEAEFEPIYKEQNKSVKPIQIKIDDEDYIIHQHSLKEHNQQNEKLIKNNKIPLSLDDILIKPKIQPYQMKNYQLSHYFENINMDSVNPAHFAVTYNLMIERGLIAGELLKPSSMYEAFEVF
ncbi:rolling circle replication-associated protein [Sulfurimonas sp.]|uniref:rolling circle replication-associated protein n=1 Tax=Sulfurimonas sp. TaxID=2022749 RepID=UPI002B4A1A0C|nr:hypothetical protein [Sulfurimonas sp.]